VKVKNVTYASGLDKVFKCHLILAGLQELRYNVFGRKVEKAVFNNLKQISTHAGEKRFSLGEVFDPMNLLALCQYEFMLRKSLPYVTTPEISKAMGIAIEAIEDVRHYFGCPRFETKDEVVIVEVDGEEGFLKAILPEKLEMFREQSYRLLPISPEDLYKLMAKDQGGFLNYNGEEQPTVDFVIELARREKL
jgi:hypothetical protein